MSETTDFYTEYIAKLSDARIRNLINVPRRFYKPGTAILYSCPLQIAECHLMNAEVGCLGIPEHLVRRPFPRTPDATNSSNS